MIWNDVNARLNIDRTTIMTLLKELDVPIPEGQIVSAELEMIIVNKQNKKPVVFRKSFLFNSKHQQNHEEKS